MLNADFHLLCLNYLQYSTVQMLVPLSLLFKCIFLKRTFLEVFIDSFSKSCLMFLISILTSCNICNICTKVPNIFLAHRDPILRPVSLWTLLYCNWLENVNINTCLYIYMYAEFWTFSTDKLRILVDTNLLYHKCLSNNCQQCKHCRQRCSSAALWHLGNHRLLP